MQKVLADQPNRYIFLLKMMCYQENIILFEIKSSVDVKKQFDRESAYKKKILKTKTDFDGNEATNFFDKKLPTAVSNHTCLAVISLDFSLNKDSNYCMQVFLKQ